MNAIDPNFPLAAEEGQAPALADFLNDLSLRLTQSQALLGAIEQRFFENVVDPVTAIGGDLAKDCADVVSLHSVLQRDLSATGDLIEQHFGAFTTEASPIVRHVQIRRAAADVVATEWDAHMRQLREARAAEERYEREVWRPAHEREEAFLKDQHPADDDARATLRAAHPDEYVPEAVHTELDRLQGVRCDLEMALLEKAAPTPAALRWKLDHILTFDDGTDSIPAWNRHLIAQTIADYRRFLGGPA